MLHTIFHKKIHWLHMRKWYRNFKGSLMRGLGRLQSSSSSITYVVIFVLCMLLCWSISPIWWICVVSGQLCVYAEVFCSYVVMEFHMWIICNSVSYMRDLAGSLSDHWAGTIGRKKNKFTLSSHSLIDLSISRPITRLSSRDRNTFK